MKQILIDDASNAFAFDGMKVTPLGKAVKFEDLWQGKVFAIGKSIYLKTGQDYNLLAENAKFLPFGKPNPYAQKQFETIGNDVLYVEQGIPGILRFPNAKAYAPLYVPDLNDLGNCAFAVCSENKVAVYVQNTELGVVRSQSNTVFYHGALVWNGHGYLVNDGVLIRSPWRVQYMMDAYLILKMGEVLFAFHTDGTVQALGTETRKEITKVGELLVAQKDDITSCYYLGKESLQEVVSVSDKNENEYFRIHHDGDIEYHNSYYMSYDDPDVDDNRMYVFADGKYICK